MAKFKKGESGNPAGRPRGVQDRRTALAKKMLSDNTEAILDAGIAAAMGGDSQILKFFLDRLVPRREDMVQVDLGSDPARSILEAVATGEMAPADGKTISDIVKVVDIEQQLRELAAQVAELKSGGIR